MPYPRLLRRVPRAGFVVCALAVVCLPRTVCAQNSTDSDVEALRREIATLRQEYEQRLASLEQRLADLAAVQEMAAAVPPPSPVPATAPATAAPASNQRSNYFNPAISLVGNFLAVGGQGRDGDLPNAELRESEVGFQAVVDPYARADVYLAFGEEGVEVEEGYVTLTALPWQLLAKVGRMRTQFGKTNTLHLHTLPWADQPLPVTNLLGEEGWISSGVSLGRLIPLGNTFSELTVEVLRADAEGLFESESSSDVAWNGRYRLFRDLSDATNLEVGLSYGFGPNGSEEGGGSEEGAETRLSGLDFTWRWKPLQQGLYRGAMVRGEVFRSEREQPGGRQDALGWYLAADYQLARRWWLGGRYEWSERATEADLRDTGEALLLTFDPSEYLRLRGELRHRDLAEGRSITDFLLQLQFSIGAHGAHPF